MADRRYEVQVTGALSQRARAAFIGMDVTEMPGETITSVIHHAEGLQELLTVARSLGLQVLSVHQVAP
jgi:hypothetical protein